MVRCTAFQLLVAALAAVAPPGLRAMSVSPHALLGGGAGDGAGAVMEHGISEEGLRCPSMFVAVISGLENLKRRHLIRDMWKNAGDGWGSVEAKFAICSGSENETVPRWIRDEMRVHGDIMMMDCAEGYKDGILTRKVEAAMSTYVRNYSSRYELFMKIDDDTFISTQRLCSFLHNKVSKGSHATHIYMGVFAEAKENLDSTHAPIRDPESPWYEPMSKFSEEFYPISAKGGPGYLLSGGMVRRIIESGIAQQNELNNEDKAVGLWVEKLVKDLGFSVRYVNVPGTDGYPEHEEWITTSGSYGEYNHIMHHHLTGEAIACLYAVDACRDPARRVDECFPRSFAEVSLSARRWGATFTPTGPRIHMPFGATLVGGRVGALSSQRIDLTA